LAYGALAQGDAVFSYYGVLSPEVAYGKAVAAARRALELDGAQAEAHAALAYTKMS
jgi:hypothetical protein